MKWDTGDIPSRLSVESLISDARTCSIASMMSMKRISRILESTTKCIPDLFSEAIPESGDVDDDGDGSSGDGRHDTPTKDTEVCKKGFERFGADDPPQG
jgi:hypothetical protein